MDVIEALDREEIFARRAMARRLALVDELDARKRWREDGATCTSAWLCARYGASKGTAIEHVRVARALRDLPAIRGAFAEGLLSWDQLRPLVRFAGEAEDEAWARKAQGMSPAELWREEARRKEVPEAQAEEDRELRRVGMRWDEEGRFLELWGILPAEQGAAVEEALRRRAEGVVLEDDPLYDRAGAGLADALEELATSEGGRPGAPTLVVHTDAAVLAGSDGAAREAGTGLPALSETENGIRLTGETVRRLACDARIEWVLEGSGRPVGIGRGSRAVPGWLSRLLRHRDRGWPLPRGRAAVLAQGPPPVALGPGRAHRSRQPRARLPRPPPARARAGMDDLGPPRTDPAVPPPRREPAPAPGPLDPGGALSAQPRSGRASTDGSPVLSRCP